MFTDGSLVFFFFILENQSFIDSRSSSGRIKTDRDSGYFPGTIEPLWGMHSTLRFAHRVR